MGKAFLREPKYSLNSHHTTGVWAQYKCGKHDGHTEGCRDRRCPDHSVEDVMRLENGSLANWVLNVILIVDSALFYWWEHRKGKNGK